MLSAKLSYWTTCIRFLRSIMSRICFTLVTDDRLRLFSKLAALAVKSFSFFFPFVTILAHIRFVHSVRAAVAA